MLINICTIWTHQCFLLFPFFFFFGFFLEKILCHLSKNYKIYKVTAERAFFRDTAYHSKVLPKLETLKLYITAPLIYFHGLWNANKWLNKSRYHPATGTEEEGNSQPTCTDCFYMTRFFILFSFHYFCTSKTPVKNQTDAF